LPCRAGYEIRKVSSKLNPENIVSILKSFLLFLSQRRRVEKNLLAKRLLKEILYFTETIKITLFYSENLENSETKQSPALLSQGRANFSEAITPQSLLPQQREFVSSSLAPGRGFEPLKIL